jgi:hypothetical protein
MVGPLERAGDGGHVFRVQPCLSRAINDTMRSRVSLSCASAACSLASAFACSSWAARNSWTVACCAARAPSSSLARTSSLAFAAASPETARSRSATIASPSASRSWRSPIELASRKAPSTSAWAAGRVHEGVHDGVVQPRFGIRVRGLCRLELVTDRDPRGEDESEGPLGDIDPVVRGRDAAAEVVDGRRLLGDLGHQIAELP